MNIALKYRDRVDASLMLPQVDWRKTTNERRRHPDRAAVSTARI
jgi:hypothetical protein